MESGPPGHEIALRNIKIVLGNVCFARARFARSRDRLEKRYQKVLEILLFRSRKRRDGPMRETVKNVGEFHTF